MPVTLELVYLEMKIASPFRLQYNEVDWSFEKDLAMQVESLHENTLWI